MKPYNTNVTCGHVSVGYGVIGMKKKCTECGKELDIELFRKDKYKKDGHSCKCKVCLSKKDKQYYAKNAEHKKYVVKQYMKKTGEYYRYKPYNPKYYSSEKSKLKKRARDLRRRLQLNNNGCGKSYLDGNTISKVLKKYEGKCVYCKINCENSYHIDHKLPVSRGGDNSFDNLALACPHCNLSKGAKTDYEFYGHKIT